VHTDILSSNPLQVLLAMAFYTGQVDLSSVGTDEITGYSLDDLFDVVQVGRRTPEPDR
jgi:hypothetical protein